MFIKNTIRKKYTVSEWDLSEIIGNGGDKNMAKSQKTLQADAVKFAKKYRNVKVTISADAFYKAISDINCLYENTKSVTELVWLTAPFVACMPCSTTNRNNRRIKTWGASFSR